jgi:Flagellar biosynthesis pathway, component FlhB
MAQGDRTEKPTTRKLDESRRKGQVARSRHVGEVAGLIAGLGALSFWGGRLIEGLETELANGIARASINPAHVVSPGEITGVAIAGARVLALLVGPVSLAAAAAVVAAHAAQVGWLVTFEPLQFNFGRLNPVNGLRQFGLKRGGTEALKALAVVIVLGWISRTFVTDLVLDAPRLARIAPADAAYTAWMAMRGLLWKSVLVLGTVAGADYLFQRRQHTSSLMMTKQEVKDDTRMSEGSPETKGRVRRVMIEMFKRRMMAAVPKATVVITNPTHYAVALEYHRQTMPAPVIVAMGKDHVALRIKAIARENGVPTVENVALAQALYRTCEVGDTVPAHLFEAVAEVLAYLIRLKQLVLN